MFGDFEDVCCIVTGSVALSCKAGFELVCLFSCGRILRYLFYI